VRQEAQVQVEGGDPDVSGPNRRNDDLVGALRIRSRTGSTSSDAGAPVDRRRRETKGIAGANVIKLFTAVSYDFS